MATTFLSKESLVNAIGAWRYFNDTSSADWRSPVYIYNEQLLIFRVIPVICTNIRPWDDRRARASSSSCAHSDLSMCCTDCIFAYPTKNDNFPFAQFDQPNYLWSICALYCSLDACAPLVLASLPMNLFWYLSLILLNLEKVPPGCECAEVHQCWKHSGDGPSQTQQQTGCWCKYRQHLFMDKV